MINETHIQEAIKEEITLEDLVNDLWQELYTLRECARVFVEPDPAVLVDTVDVLNSIEKHLPKLREAVEKAVLQ